jgi:cytochrome c oxidase subunit III
MSQVYDLRHFRRDEGLATPAAAKLGLWLFMGVVSVLFLLLTLAYLSRAQIDDWQALAGAPWLPLGQPWRLWVNTALLAAGSGALQWAAMAARRGDARGTRLGLSLGGLLAVGFLVGQLWVWQALSGAGYVVAANPANSFFYMLTALHGLHLIGGLVAWARITASAWSGVSAPRVQLHLMLCSRYWHFLLALWLVLFALLTSPPENLAALAAFCGLR